MDQYLIGNKQDVQYMLYSILGNNYDTIKKMVYPSLEKSTEKKIEVKMPFKVKTVKPTEQKETKTMKLLYDYYMGKIDINKLDMDDPIIKQRFS